MMRMDDAQLDDQGDVKNKSGNWKRHLPGPSTIMTPVR